MEYPVYCFNYPHAFIEQKYLTYKTQHSFGNPTVVFTFFALDLLHKAIVKLVWNL